MNQELIFSESIILIGPMGTGKSTIAKVLSEKTGMPNISLDNRKYYPKGFYENTDFDYQKKYELELANRILSGINEPSIIDFGAGHSVYENPEMFEELKKTLDYFRNVVLILPSSNMAESINILNERRKFSIMSESDKENWRFLTFKGNEELATIIVYTNNKTPEDVSNEVLELISSKESEVKR